MINIKQEVIKHNLVPVEPWIEPMSAIRDQDIFEYLANKYIKEDIVIETGTHGGLSALFLAHCTKTVHTFDIVDFKEKYPIWEHFNVNKENSNLNINFHLIKNDQEKDEILNKMKPLNNIFAWIDGRHHGGVDVDFNMFRKYGCKKFLFHDYVPSKSRLNGKGLYDYVFTYLESIKPNAKIVEVKPPFIYMEFE